jgi:adenine deaminase
MNNKKTTPLEGGNALPAKTKEASIHNDEENVPEIQEESPETPPTERRTRTRRLVWGGVLLAVVVVVAVILGCVYGIDGNNEDSRGDSTGSTTTTLHGQIVDIHNREIYQGTVVVNGDRITKIEKDDRRRLSAASPLPYILPGFIDSHVHIESSLLIPSEFARLAVRHGTVATVSDPHEIVNVLGLQGLDFMLENAEQVPFYFFFGAPSCVPATPFETAGAEINVTDIEDIFEDKRIKFLSEMMNWPGVLFNDTTVLAKLQAAKDAGRPVDGHAPGLTGEQAITYIQHGITTDHECYMLNEAQDKLAAGMKIQIRQGSASRNFEELHPIIGTHPDQVMFCTDDAHPDMLVKGEIDYHVRRSLELGYDLFDVLRIASKNPVDHYGLPVGLLRPGDSADFIIVNNLVDVDILETWIHGKQVAAKGETLIESVATGTPINNFGANPITTADIVRQDTGQVRVIVAHDGLIVTSEEILSPADADVLKIVVVNRYHDAPPAVAYIKGFGLKKGALASSVAHDSHNIVAVGVSDDDIVNAINGVIEYKGGLAVSSEESTEVIALPVAGLMSEDDAFQVAERYTAIDSLVKQFGSALQAPFMTLSFMALLVIPDLKLSDKGLFDGRTFQFVDVAVE